MCMYVWMCMYVCVCVGAGIYSYIHRCGSFFYISPEIVQGVPYGKKTDIWTLACILYELANGDVCLVLCCVGVLCCVVLYGECVVCCIVLWCVFLLHGDV